MGAAQSRGNWGAPVVVTLHQLAETAARQGRLDLQRLMDCAPGFVKVISLAQKLS